MFQIIMCHDHFLKNLEPWYPTGFGQEKWKWTIAGAAVDVLSGHGLLKLEDSKEPCQGGEASGPTKYRGPEAARAKLLSSVAERSLAASVFQAIWEVSSSNPEPESKREPCQVSRMKKKVD